MALVFAMLAGMVGLAVDYGAGTMDFRLLRNATDSAAVSATIAMIDNPGSRTPVSIVTTVSNMMSRSQLPSGTSTSCNFVDSSGVAFRSGCAGTPPTNASGVQITGGSTRPTYFAGLLGTPSLTVQASSTVQGWAEDTYDAGASLFIVCGYGTLLANNAGSMSILTGTAPGVSPWLVDTNAVGRTFRVHDQTQVARCGQGSDFKGLNGSTGNVVLPTNLVYTNGQVASIQVTVPALHGCRANQPIDNCVMLIPIAVGLGTDPQTQLRAVRWLPFWITVNGNGHDGILMDVNYVVAHNPAGGTTSWNSTMQSGPVSVRIAG